jgi:hypothetical protein
VLFMRENWCEFLFLAKGKNKELSPAWAPLRMQLGCVADRGTCAQHMSVLPLNAEYESLPGSARWGFVGRAVPPTCKAEFDFQGGRRWMFCSVKYEQRTQLVPIVRT